MARMARPATPPTMAPTTVPVCIVELDVVSVVAPEDIVASGASAVTTTTTGEADESVCVKVTVRGKDKGQGQ